MKTIALLLLLAGPTATATTIDDLAWLAGAWASEDGEPGSGELWTVPAGGTMLGVSRTVRGGRTVAYEFVLIRETADRGLEYVARPSGQAGATFTMVESTDRRVVFANAAHDFPQRIIYQLTALDRLDARIEGEVDGESRAVAFPMRRVVPADAVVGTRSALVANLEAGRPQTIVTYGTSLTAEGAWVAQFQGVLDASYPGLARVVNSAASGMWCRWGVENLDERVIAKAPDVVLIEFAINDAFLDYATTPAAARQDLETMIDRILRARPRCEVILMTMNPPVGIHLERRPRIADYYDVYRDVAAQRRLMLIDHHANWQTLLDQDATTFAQYVPDGIHPNALGCEQVILPQLLQSLGCASEGR